MLVRVKWTIRQFEWYRDNKDFYYRLKQQLEAVLIILKIKIYRLFAFEKFINQSK